MNDLYFEINPTLEKIISSPIELDINWSNISGIIFLSSDELYDLSWAGHPNFGFVKVCTDNIELLKRFTFTSDILNYTKIKYKNIISEICQENESNPVIIDNLYSVQLTEKNKLDIIMKYNECLLNENLEFNWKTTSGFMKFNSKMFINLYKKIQIHKQKLIDLEYELHTKVENCNNIEDLLRLDIEKNYFGTN